MADEADHASAITEAERDRLVGAARGVTTGLGEDFCVSCGVEIPTERRKAVPHAKRCVDCQESFEAGSPRLGRAL